MVTVNDQCARQGKRKRVDVDNYEIFECLRQRLRAIFHPHNFDAFEECLVILDEIKSCCSAGYLNSDTHRHHLLNCMNGINTSNYAKKIKTLADNMANGESDTSQCTTNKLTKPSVPRITPQPQTTQTTARQQITPFPQTPQDIRANVISALLKLKSKYITDFELKSAIGLLVSEAKKTNNTDKSVWSKFETLRIFTLLNENKQSFSVLYQIKIFLDIPYFTTNPIYIRPLDWFENVKDISRVNLREYIMFVIFKRLCIRVIPSSHEKFVKTFCEHFKLAKSVSKRDALQRISSVKLVDDDNVVSDRRYGAQLLKCLSDCMERFIALKHSKTELQVINLDDFDDGANSSGIEKAVDVNAVENKEPHSNSDEVKSKESEDDSHKNDSDNEERNVLPDKENMDRVPPMPRIKKLHRLLMDANKFLNFKKQLIPKDFFNQKTSSNSDSASASDDELSETSGSNAKNDKKYDDEKLDDDIQIIEVNDLSESTDERRNHQSDNEISQLQERCNESVGKRCLIPVLKKVDIFKVDNSNKCEVTNKNDAKEVKEGVANTLSCKKVVALTPGIDNEDATTIIEKNLDPATDTMAATKDLNAADIIEDNDKGDPTEDHDKAVVTGHDEVTTSNASDILTHKPHDISHVTNNCNKNDEDSDGVTIADNATTQNIIDDVRTRTNDKTQESQTQDEKGREEVQEDCYITEMKTMPMVNASAPQTIPKLVLCDEEDVMYLDNDNENTNSADTGLHKKGLEIDNATKHLVNRKRVSLVPVVGKSKKEDGKTPEEPHKINSSSNKTSHNPKPGCSTESQPETDSDDLDVDETTEEYNTKLKQIRTLSKKITKVARRIKALQEADIDLEEMGKWCNLYCQEEKFKKKHRQLLRKLEEVQGSMNVDYDFYVKVECGIPKISKFVQDRLNHKQKFPDIEDVRKLVVKSLERFNMRMKETKIDVLSRQIFLDVGSQIQNHRKTELRLDGGFHLMDKVDLTRDPAKSDVELRKKLKQNRKRASEKMASIEKKYEKKQLELELQDDDIFDTGIEDDEKEKECKPSSNSENSGSDNESDEDQEKADDEEDDEITIIE